jgi:hypothetical protein
MPVIEVVFNGRDNANDLVLLADGAPADLASVTRIRVVGSNAEVEVDSALSPEAINWATGITGTVHLGLGHEELPVGNHACRVIVYDPANPNGIDWGLVVLSVKGP